MLLALTAAAPAIQPEASVHIAPGDFRWIPVGVRRTPVVVDGTFKTQSGAAVHIELMPMADFRRFLRGADHDTLARTSSGASGEFRRVVDRPGQYAVLIDNEDGKHAATVTVEVRTVLDPAPGDVATELSPARRAATILASFTFFFAAVGIWGAKLLRELKGSSR